MAIRSSNSRNNEEEGDSLEEPLPEQQKQQQVIETDVAVDNAYVVGHRPNRSIPLKSKQLELVDAAVIPEDEGARNSRSLYYLCILVAILVIGGAAIGAGVGISSSKKTSKTKGPDVSAAPTNMPSTSPPTLIPTTTPSGMPSPLPTISMAPTTERLALLLEEMTRQFVTSTQDSLQEQLLMDRSSPLYKAAQWLAETSNDDVANRLDDFLPFPPYFEQTPNQFRFLIQLRQRYALAVLYFATNGDNWMNTCKFLNPTLHVCDWKCDWPSFSDLAVVQENPLLAEYLETGRDFLPHMGVDCDEDNHIIFIELPANGLEGTLPTEVAEGLDFLEGFQLPVNHLFGSVPLAGFSNTLSARLSSVGPKVSILHLEDNLFQGTISDAVGALTNLRLLHLSNNQLTGSIPSALANLESLAALYAPHNDLTGTIPSSLFQNANLQHLALSNNQFTGSLPNQITNPSEILSLEHNAFVGSLPELVGDALLANLQLLTLDNNFFSGTLPSNLFRLRSIHRLALGQNFNLTGPAFPKNCCWADGSFPPPLELLDISETKLTGTLPSNIARLADSLKFLLYSGNRFVVGSIPTEFDLLTNLEWLNLGSNSLAGGTIPSELGQLTNLRVLGLQDNGLVGTVPTELLQLTSLVTLSLHTNFLTGSLEPLCAVEDNARPPAWRLGFLTDCLTDQIECNCCTECCDGEGNCEPN